MFIAHENFLEKAGLLKMSVYEAGKSSRSASFKLKEKYKNFVEGKILV